MDKIYQDILMGQFLESLLSRVRGEMNQIAQKKKANQKDINLMIREEKAKRTIKDLIKIGEEHYWELIQYVKKKYDVKLEAFERKEEKK